MEQAGAKPIDVRRSRVSAGELVVLPDPNTNVFGVPPDLTRLLETLEGAPSRGLATVAPGRGAMFYGDMPLPFAIARGQHPSVRVYEMHRGPATR
jgi:hypothetical protein